MKHREIMTQFSTALGKLDMAYALVAQEYNLTFNGLMTLYIIDESDTVTQKKSVRSYFYRNQQYIVYFRSCKTRYSGAY